MSINNDSTTNIHSPNSSLLGLNNLNQILAISNNEFPNHAGGDSTSNNISCNSSGNSADNMGNSNTKISAYARLDFDSFTFYIQTLEVVLGRRVQNDNSYTVDVNLGPKKAVSRKHAKIFYNFGSQKFEISVLGRNGLFVDNNFIEKGSTVTLSDGNKIQIGPVIFNFVLPNNNNTNEQDGLKKLSSANRNTPGKLSTRKNSNTLKKVQKVKKEIKNNEQTLLKSQPKAMADKLTLITSLEDSSTGTTKTKTKNNKGDLTSTTFAEAGLSSPLDSKGINLDSTLFKNTVSPIDEHSLNKLLEMTKTPTTPFLPLSPSVTNQIDTVLNSLDTKKLEATTGLNVSNLNIPALNEVINAPASNTNTSPSSNNKRTSQNSSTIIGSTNKVTKPTKVTDKKTAKKEKPAKPKKQPKKVYTLEEIPEKYRTKPSTSYSNIIIHCLKTYCSENKGMSLSEIYKAIQELYPYYKYCPDGWQSSVRHNLSLNKAFRKISKEGKGWLWGLDQEYFVEKDKVKKKPTIADSSRLSGTSVALSKSANNTKTTTPLRTASNLASSAPKTVNMSKATTPKPKLTAEDKQILNILQEQLKAITKNIKGLSKEDVIKLLTAALSSTMSQLQKSSAGQSILKYVQTNPDILTKILTSSLNGATLKVTNGKWNFSDLISGKVKLPAPQSKPKSLNSIPLIPLKPIVKNKAAPNTHSSNKSVTGRVSKPASNSANRISKSGALSENSSKVTPKSINKISSTATTKDKVSMVAIAGPNKKQLLSAKTVSKQVDVSSKLSEQDKIKIKKETEILLPATVKKEPIGDNETKTEAKHTLSVQAVNITPQKRNIEAMSADIEMKKLEFAKDNYKNIPDVKTESEEKESKEEESKEEVSEKDAENDDEYHRITAKAVLEKVKNRSASFVALERNLDKLINATSSEVSDNKIKSVCEISSAKENFEETPKKKSESNPASTFEKNLDSFLAGENNLFTKDVRSGDDIKKLNTDDDSATDNSNNNACVNIISKTSTEVKFSNSETDVVDKSIVEANESSKITLDDLSVSVLESVNAIGLDQPIISKPKIPNDEDIDISEQPVTLNPKINKNEDNAMSEKDTVSKSKVSLNEGVVMLNASDTVNEAEENLKDSKGVMSTEKEKVEDKKDTCNANSAESMQNKILNTSRGDELPQESDFESYGSKDTPEQKKYCSNEATSVLKIGKSKETTSINVSNNNNSQDDTEETSGKENKAVDILLKT